MRLSQRAKGGPHHSFEGTCTWRTGFKAEALQHLSHEDFGKHSLPQSLVVKVIQVFEFVILTDGDICALFGAMFWQAA